jgi:hypothetical protein
MGMLDGGRVNDSDVDQLRQILHPLVCDIESEPYPPITAASLARRTEATAR